MVPAAGFFLAVKWNDQAMTKIKRKYFTLGI